MNLRSMTVLLRSSCLALAAVLALAACGGDDADGASGAGGAGGSSDGECKVGGGEAAVGPCLVAAHAGTFAVTATSGAHARGTVTIGADGGIDYDTNLLFAIADYQGVYDRLECCQRISVEMNPRADNDMSLAPDARHRVDVFTASSVVGSEVVRFEYFPNWPSTEGQVNSDVQ